MSLSVMGVPEFPYLTQIITENKFKLTRVSNGENDVSMQTRIDKIVSSKISIKQIMVLIRLNLACRLRMRNLLIGS